MRHGTQTLQEVEPHTSGHLVQGGVQGCCDIPCRKETLRAQVRAEAVPEDVRDLALLNALARVRASSLGSGLGSGFLGATMRPKGSVDWYGVWYVGNVSRCASSVYMQEVCMQVVGVQVVCMQIVSMQIVSMQIVSMQIVSMQIVSMQMVGALYQMSLWESEHVSFRAVWGVVRNGPAREGGSVGRGEKWTCKGGRGQEQPGLGQD